ncbi:transposase [Mycobacterium intracellulare]|nr:transposase [Mycobacterium intracellulare]
MADTITEIHQRSRGTYGGRRIRAALLADYDMNVNLKLVRSIMGEHGLCGLPHPPRRLPNLIRVKTPADLVNRQFTATQPNQLWCTDITEHPPWILLVVATRAVYACSSKAVNRSAGVSQPRVLRGRVLSCSATA